MSLWRWSRWSEYHHHHLMMFTEYNTINFCPNSLRLCSKRMLKEEMAAMKVEKFLLCCPQRKRHMRLGPIAYFLLFLSCFFLSFGTLFVPIFFHDSISILSLFLSPKIREIFKWLIHSLTQTNTNQRFALHFLPLSLPPIRLSLKLFLHS